MILSRKTVEIGPEGKPGRPYPREHLKHSPLVEALLEIQAPLTTPYDLVPGALRQELRGSYPVVERVNSVQVNNMAYALGPNLVNIRLRSEDGRRMIQCGPEVVTINMLAPYPGFEEFERMMRSTIETFYAVAQPQKPRHLSLRYINLLLPEQINQPDALNIGIFGPDVLPDERGFVIKSVHPYPDARGELVISAGYPHAMANGTVGFLLDFEFDADNPESGELGSIFAWAKNAHDVIYQAFRSCIGESILQKLR